MEFRIYKVWRLEIWLSCMRWLFREMPVATVSRHPSARRPCLSLGRVADRGSLQPSRHGIQRALGGTGVQAWWGRESRRPGTQHVTLSNSLRPLGIHRRLMKHRLSEGLPPGLSGRSHDPVDMKSWNRRCSQSGQPLWTWVSGWRAGPSGTEVSFVRILPAVLIPTCSLITGACDLMFLTLSNRYLLAIVSQSLC